MTAGAQSRSERVSEPDTPSNPPISACESTPGNVVFLEAGNTDGWIASTLTVDLTR